MVLNNRGKPNIFYLLSPGEHLLHVVLGVLDVFNAHDALEQDICLRVGGGVHYARAVDEEDTPEERDVLPYFGLAGHRGHRANLVVVAGGLLAF